VVIHCRNQVEQRPPESEADEDDESLFDPEFYELEQDRLRAMDEQDG
jgi:hypothetical protein